MCGNSISIPLTSRLQASWSTARTPGHSTDSTGSAATCPPEQDRAEITKSNSLRRQAHAGLVLRPPDASHPTQTKQIWTQGEAEDTRYYIPIYDYPNDRTTWDMVLTVPRGLGDGIQRQTGQLANAAQGMKTWSWSQTQAVPTYLISVVAGEFESRSSTWRSIPVDYIVPRGYRERIAPSFFPHTRHAHATFPTAWAFCIRGTSTTSPWWINSWWAAWKTSALPR